VVDVGSIFQVLGQMTLKLLVVLEESQIRYSLSHNFNLLIRTYGRQVQWVLMEAAICSDKTHYTNK